MRQTSVAKSWLTFAIFLDREMMLRTQREDHPEPADNILYYDHLICMQVELEDTWTIHVH